MGLVSNIAASGTPRHNVEAEHSIRVAVIDDSADYRTVICELLQMLFDVEIVGVGSNGFEAIELTAQTAPDLVIMDVHKPKHNKKTTTNHKHQHKPTTTILMM